MNSKLVNLAGVGIGVALASGCISRGTATFPGGTAEPDLSRPGENPMPQAVSPVQPGNVVYPSPQPEKKPEYWQQVNDPYAELSKGRPYVGQGFVIAPPAGTAAAGASVYVVKSGDTFGGIAQRNKTTVKALKAANPGIDYDRIRVGQKINIPAATASGAKASSSASSAPQAGIHVVKSGEILGRIASQYGVKVADLKAANGLTGDKITVGQKLRIPGKAAAAPAKAPAKAPAGGTIEVAPSGGAIPPPDIPETIAPSLEIAPPSLETPAPQPVAAGAAAGEATTVYLANGRQDLYNIAVEKTIGIGEIERLNPSLAGNRSRILPAGTPVVLPAR